MILMTRGIKALMDEGKNILEWRVVWGISPHPNPIAENLFSEMAYILGILTNTIQLYSQLVAASFIECSDI